MPPAVARARELAAERRRAPPRSSSRTPRTPPRTARAPAASSLGRSTRSAPPDAFVAGVGTGGTLTGVSGVLRRARPGALVVAVEPDACAVLSGGAAGATRIQGLGAGFVPAVLDRAAYDRVDRGRATRRPGR